MLTHIEITHLSGIERIGLDFGMRTYIRGANGSGKTHILDAIHILSGSLPLYGSLRLSDGSSIEGVYRSTDLSRTYRIARDGDRDIMSIQGQKSTKTKYRQELLWRTVSISPFDMNLMYFAPSMRREYIDLILDRAYSQFSGVKKDYEQVMRQRNSLLKKVRDGEAQRADLDFWDQKFASLADTYGSYRAKYRDVVVTKMDEFPQFFGNYPLQFVYESSWIDADDREHCIQEYLRANRERDILTGHTHIGPHRDDWGFQVMNNDSGIMSHEESAAGEKFGNQSIPAQEFLSRGEMKMILLGLKMIEADFLSHTLDLPVILLIDDIFAELDDTNSEIFLNSFMPYQVILTSQKPLPNQEKHHDFICINLENS